MRHTASIICACSELLMPVKMGGAAGGPPNLRWQDSRPGIRQTADRSRIDAAADNETRPESQNWQDGKLTHACSQRTAWSHETCGARKSKMKFHSVCRREKPCDSSAWMIAVSDGVALPEWRGGNNCYSTEARYLPDKQRGQFGDYFPTSIRYDR